MRFIKTVIFRPTNNCNLRCSYCYDKNSHDNCIGNIKNSSTELFKREEDNVISSLDKLYENEDRPTIIFHGGEPLLINSDVLDEFCNEITKNRNLDIHIQTNGTLIDEGVIELFKKYNFKVGLSLDGCNEKQNYARVFPNGKNSFNRVLDRIKILKDNDIKFGLIMSINKIHSGSCEELYNFIAENDLNCNIRPIFAKDSDTTSKVMSVSEYSEFFNNLFDIWFDDKEKKVDTHQILELYKALRMVIDNNYRDNTCNSSDSCFREFISLDVLSNLYACNRLYGIDKFYYGNLLNCSMEDVNKKIDLLLNERNNSINNKCGNCERLNKCHGGCIAEAYSMYGDILEPTVNCKVEEKVLKHVRNRLYGR